MADRAAVNGATPRRLATVVSRIMAIPCLTFLHVSSKILTPLSCTVYFRIWVSLFKTSYKARNLWRAHTDDSSAVRIPNETRWWVFYETVEQAQRVFNINGSAPYKELLVQMAVYCDAGKLLCELTYTLEGDGFYRISHMPGGKV